MSEYAGEDQISKTIDLLMYMVIAFSNRCASGLPHTLAESGDGRDMNSSLSLRCSHSLV